MPHRPLALPCAWPLHGLSATRQLERQLLALAPASPQAPSLPMQRAGQAVARLARALAPHARQMWIAAGPGNNGGDGLVAATLLHEAGVNVCVSLVSDPADLPPDARAAWEQAARSGVRIVARPAPLYPLKPQDLAIDAVLGLGANRAPDKALAALLEALSGVRCPVLAVDLPSGLNVDTGQPLGDWSVRATHTLSLLTLKPGLFTGSGRDHAGEVWFDDLGGDPQAARLCADAWLPAAPSSPAAPRRHAQHKGSFGDVAVVGGSSGMAGGALLAARAAHAAGAGRVHVDLLQTDPPTLDGERPELMFRHGWWRVQTPATLEPFTVVAGCGGGQAVGESLPPLLSHAPRLVLDADALNRIAADTSLQALLAARSGKGRETVLTPHPLEAARLLGRDSASAVQADRLAAATALAERFCCVVLLKGSGSVVASPGERPSINPTGNAALASAGTGDVLAGWVAGHWSAHRGTAHEAAVHSAWWHGHAADTSPERTQRAADLVDALHALQRRH